MAGCWLQHTNVRSFVLSFLSLFLWYNSLLPILQSLPRLLYLNLPRCCFPAPNAAGALGVVGPPLQSGVLLLLRYVCRNSANRNQRRFEAAHQVTSILISLPPSFVLLSRGITTPTAVRPPAGVEESAAAEGSADGWMVGVAPPRASLPPSPALPPSL